MERFARITTTSKHASRNAIAVATHHDKLPIDLTIAGVGISMTRDGAQHLIAQLQRALAGRGPGVGHQDDDHPGTPDQVRRDAARNRLQNGI